MPEERTSPYSAFNFQVDIMGGEISAGFSEVTGLGVEITMAEYRDGNDPENHVRKIPNINKVSDVTLKRGIIKSKDIWDWINTARSEGWAARRNVIVSMLDEARENTVATWILQNAVPIKYTGPSLNAKGGTDVAMEELVLSAEGLKYRE